MIDLHEALDREAERFSPTADLDDVLAAPPARSAATPAAGHPRRPSSPVAVAVVAVARTGSGRRPPETAPRRHPPHPVDIRADPDHGTLERRDRRPPGPRAWSYGPPTRPPNLAVGGWARIHRPPPGTSPEPPAGGVGAPPAPWTVRVIEIDGVGQSVTKDLRADRIDVALRDGRVARLHQVRLTAARHAGRRPAQ